MKILRLVVAIAFVIGPISVFAQYKQSTDTLLDHMTGKWLLKGVIAGRNIEHDISVSWVLGHQYIEMKETSHEKLADGTPSYEAIVFISRDESRNKYDCLWLDNTSNSGLSNEIIAHTKPEPDRIALLFKFNDATYFHTTLTFNKVSNSWHWLMTNEENGKTTLFADAIMSKFQQKP